MNSYNGTMWLHEAVAKGRKRGWFKCQGCGITFSMADGDMPINHVKNNECAQEIDSVKRSIGFDPRKTLKEDGR